jgi:dipeptidyl aminopeptidase/acylaminoacyl peptidase
VQDSGCGRDISFQAVAWWEEWAIGLTPRDAAVRWESGFDGPQLLTVRPTAAQPSAALVVVAESDGAYGVILDDVLGMSASRLPLSLGYDSLLSNDRKWVLQLADQGGSEVGHLCAFAVDGAESIDLTPGWDPYVLRGLGFSGDGSLLVAATVDERGHHLVVIPASPWGAPSILASTPNECWWPRVSADARLLSADTTDHNPGIRRSAITVYDVASAQLVAVLNDLPAGPVRAVRFSPTPGDNRLLLTTERTGFARPAIWDPVTGNRVDYPLSQLRGEVIPLDWDDGHGRVLVLHVGDGIHHLALLDTATSEIEVIRTGTGSYAEPDVGSPTSYYWMSHFGSAGAVRVIEQAWTTAPRLIERAADGTTRVLFSSYQAQAGLALESVMVTSRDGTRVQLWWAAPSGQIRGTVIEVHGGPNLVTADHYSPEAQAWLAEGLAYASLNYRGSVTFGRDFREGFWGGAGDREIDDVKAALDWLRGVGLADPATTFVTGESYGGLLSLLSVGRLPDDFAGAFARVAMADWSAAFAEMNPAIRTAWIGFLTSPPHGSGQQGMTLEAAIARFSPINYVSDVKASVWMLQGRLDTRTPPTQATGYANALRDAGGDVVLEWFDAGHEPVGLAGRRRAQRRMLALADAKLARLRWDQLEA